MSDSKSATTVEAAIEQLGEALGHEVTGINMNLADGKVELTLGSKTQTDSKAVEADPEGVDVGEMSWNDMVSFATQKGLFETGMNKDELEAKLREEGYDTIEDGETDTDSVSIEELAEKVSEGDLEMDDAKERAKSEGLAVNDLFIAVNGDCQSRRDCGHGAKSAEADFCWKCVNDGVPPKEGYKGLTESQAEAAVTISEGDDDTSLEEAAEVFN